MKILSFGFLILLSTVAFLILAERYWFFPRFQTENMKDGLMVELGEGRRVYANDSGAAERGHTFLLETGIGGVSQQARPVFNRLSKYGRVISFDRFTYGLSEAPVDDLSIEQAQKDVNKVLEHFGVSDSFVYIGYSMGAMYAQAFQERYPDRVKGLILLDPYIPNPKRKFPYKNYRRRSLSKAIQWQWAQILGHLGYYRQRYRLAKLSKGIQGPWEFMKSLGHLRTSTQERRSFNRLSHNMTWKIHREDQPVLLITATQSKHHKSYRIKRHRAFAEQSKKGGHLVYTEFKHGDFLLEENADKVVGSIVDYLTRNVSL